MLRIWRRGCQTPNRQEIRALYREMRVKQAVVASGQDILDLMKYRKLGRTGLEVSEIAYGLWGMGEWSGSDDRASLESLQRSVELGCNFFDSAWAYGNGKSDGLLGEILKRNRDKRLYAASKIPPLNDKWPASPKDKYQDVFPATCSSMRG